MLFGLNDKEWSTLATVFFTLLWINFGFNGDRVPFASQTSDYQRQIEQHEKWERDEAKRLEEVQAILNK